MAIRVVIAEDQFLVLDALALLLGREPDIDVVAQARTGREAVLAASAHVPDVMLMDIEMPDGDGIETTRTVKAAHPEIRVAILTTFSRPGYLRRSLEAGATGFLLKDEPVEKLAQHVRRLAEGERIIDPALAFDALAGGPNPLTAREAEVLRAAAGGADAARIAKALFLSEGTVRNYLSVAIQKLGVQNRTQAVEKAREQGWV